MSGTESSLTNEQIEALPNPHLRHYLDNGYFDMSPMVQRKALRQAYLKAARLPREYDQLGSDEQFVARMKVLTGWYDPAKPAELCSDVEALIAAHFLWVEFYLKPDRHTGGFYFFKDNRVKYDLIRACMSPPLVDTEAAKTVIHLPRGTTKTMTVVRELCSMIAISRPQTGVLVSEANKSRTSEELLAIRLIYMNNELIERDFGGKGTLFDTSQKGANRWNESRLDILNFPNCFIMGYSASSKQRGRHPVLIVIDDPEDDDMKLKRSRNGADRFRFIVNLIRRFQGMVYPGGKIIWLGTVIPNSCIQIALQDLISTPIDKKDFEENYDLRFNSWRKVHIGMIQTDERTGEKYSIMPDHTSMKGYDRKAETMGLAARSAELDGIPIAEGQFALVRDKHKHGYMHCERRNNDKLPAEYMLDLNTGRIMEWREFLESLYRAAGLDPADSTSIESDLGACSAIGSSEDGVIYYLDVVAKRMMADDWPETAFGMCGEWDIPRLGIETNAMQKPIYRRACQLRLEYEQQGRHAPLCIPVAYYTQSKSVRLISLYRPLYRNYRIRFPVFEPVMLHDGVTHYPVENTNRRYFRELLGELDTYTDDGASGHDDAMDSGGIAQITLGRMRGKKPMQQDDSSSSYEKWRGSGIDWEDAPDRVPMQAWTEKMREAMTTTVETEIETDKDMDPYSFVGG